MGPTYTTTVDLSTSNGQVTVANVSGATAQLTAVSFLSGPKGDTGATGAKGDTGATGAAGSNAPSDHTLLSNIGTNTHAQIDTKLATSTTHIADTANPHSVTKTQVGLSNVDNTSDANKPVSTATATALAGKAATSHTHAESDVTNLVSDLAAKAPLASPTFTGVPTAPTATAGTSTTQLATTAFVTSASFTWKGTWTTGIAYAVNDCVNNGGSSYVCLVAHTAGTFATDLAANKWSLQTQATNYTAGTGLTLTGSAFSLTAPVSIANGGTGSTSQNFVDLSSSQTVAGVKTLSSQLNTVNVAPTTNGTGTIGDATHYYPTVYGTRHYFNSTAYLDGSTAGAIFLEGLLNADGAFIVQVNGTQGLRLLASYTGVFTDSATSAFFQVGSSGGNGLFTSASGTAFNRFAISSQGTAITDHFFDSIVIPAGVLHAKTNGDKRVLIVQGGSTQTLNLQEWRNNSGTVMSAVDVAGRQVLANIAGTPTGTPATGTMVYDTTANKLWVYNGSWRSTTLT